MEPYNPNRPTVSWKEAPKDKSELLDRLQEAGVPFTAALKYFYDNPEGPASETLNIATDETVPFKWQLRTGNATPASLAEEAVLLAAPVPKKRGWVQVDNEATKAFNNKLREMAEGPLPRGARNAVRDELRELSYLDDRGAYKDYITDLAEGMPWEYNRDFYQALEMIKNQYPNEYRNIILEDWDRFAKQPDTYTNKPIQEHFDPEAVLKYGQDPTLLESYATRFKRKLDSPSSIQFTVGELEDALRTKEAQEVKLKGVNNALDKLLNTLDNH